VRVRYTVISVLLLAAVAVGQDGNSRRSDRSSDRDRPTRSDRSTRNGSSSSAFPSSGSTTRPATFIEGYRLVLDRNIFSKNRVIYREPGSSSTTTPGTAGSSRLEPAMLLTGVTLDGNVATASIEDRRGGRTSLYRVGDALGDGKITAINIDSIEYTAGNGQAARVDLGRAIEGGPMYSVSSGSPGSSFPGSTGSSSTTAASPASPAPSPSGGGDTNDILERLRQKRLQETKR
jgi:hypothetical protein